MSGHEPTADTHRRTRNVLINVAANFGGQFWAAGLWLGAVPLYIRLLGMEEYGLIGAYLAIISTMRGLDLGMSYTVNREIARLSTMPGEQASVRDVAATFELLFATAAIGSSMLAALLAVHGGSEWLRPERLSASTVQTCMLLAAVCIGLQWLPAFYQSALMGLERQVVSNATKATEATVAHGGTLVLLWYVEPRIEIFFLMQIIASALSALFLRVALANALPRAHRRGRVHFRVAIRPWRFSSGIAFISASGMLLLNTDKLIVSKLLPLTQFGYYSLAFQLASGVVMAANAILNAVFPRFTALLAIKAEVALNEQYHLFSQLLAVVTVPLALMLSFFSEPIIAAWTSDSEAVANAAPLLRIFALGAGLNALMHAPFALQLAAAWTRIGVAINSALVLLCVPSMLVLVPRYGMIAAATVWLVLMAIYVVVSVPWTHTRFVKGAAYRWFGNDVLPTVLVSALVLWCARSVLGSNATPIAGVSMAALAMAVAVALSALAQRRIRGLLVYSWHSWRQTEH